MDDSGVRLNHILARLRERDFRITPQRMAILKILAESRDHPTVEEIYAQVRSAFPTTSLATVYKTVTLLKGLGEVLEVGTRTGSSRYDGGKPYPHPHVICTGCRAMIDFEEPALDDLTRQVAEKTGYQISDYQFDFFGLCPRCRK